jgi:type I restriction enzyme S subunit
MAKFSEVLTIVNGRNQKQVVCDDGKYPIYGSGGIMGYANDYICKAETVVIGRKGSINKPIFVETPFWNVDTAFGLCANSEKLNPKYLYYFCEKFDFEKLNTTVTIPSLTKSNLLNVEIPLPNLEKQKQIVELLDGVMSLIFLRKQQLAKLDELVKARFVEMFGDCKTNPKNWKTKALEKIANVGSSKRVFVEELQDSGIPFYRGTEIGALAEKKAVIPALFITEEHYKQLCETTGKPQKGDLLMPSICPDGRIWIVDTNEPFYFKDGRVLWVHLTSANYNSVFLLYTLKDRIMTDYASIASGTTFAELKIFALKKCKIFDVPLELQNQFANFVERVDQQKQTMQQSLEKLELMKKALMQEYFG